MITQGVFLSTVWCFTSYTSHCTRPSIRIISFRKSCMKKFVSKNWFWHGSHEIFKEDLCLPIPSPSSTYKEEDGPILPHCGLTKWLSKLKMPKSESVILTGTLYFTWRWGTNIWITVIKRSEKIIQIWKLIFKCNNDLVVHITKKLYRP